MSVASDEILDSESQAQIAALTSAAESGSLSWDDANSQANAIRDSVDAGYTVTADGTTVNNNDSGFSVSVDDANSVAEALRSSESSSSGTASSSISDNSYSSAYADQISSVLSSLLSSSYDDWKLSDEYASLSDSYTANGETAMLDTLGQVSSRTGGMASSYAGTAAQQTYNNYMDGLETAAQSAYSDYNDELYNQLSLLMGLDDSEYDRYRDTVSDSMYDQEFNYTSDQDALSQSNYETEWDYSVSQDALDQSNYETEWDYNLTQDEYDQALTKAQTLAAYGDFSGYSALGYGDAEIAAMEAAYEAEQVSNTVYVSSDSGENEDADDATSGLIEINKLDAGYSSSGYDTALAGMTTLRDSGIQRSAIQSYLYEMYEEKLLTTDEYYDLTAKLGA